VVYNGVLYVTAGLTTYAIDAATCATVWTYTYAGLKKSSAPNRGLALSEGRVIRETIDGHLIALDARTGALLWNQQVMDSGIGEIGVGAP
ncbi:outer membrane protein assembly factor BamB family protein, partial [Staphylococcus aureus]